MSCFDNHTDYLVLRVRVVPRSSKNEIQGLLGDAVKIRIQSPPVEGKANAALIKFLSKHWNIPRADIEILSGDTGRNKILRINNPTDQLRAALSSLDN